MYYRISTVTQDTFPVICLERSGMRPSRLDARHSNFKRDCPLPSG